MDSPQGHAGLNLQNSCFVLRLFQRAPVWSFRSRNSHPRSDERATEEDARRPVSRVLSAKSPDWIEEPRGTTIPLGRALRHASRDQPGRRDGKSPRVPRPGRGIPLPPLFGLAPGGVYRAAAVAGDAVRSYRTVSPLPAARCRVTGGLISVALSLGSPPPAVSRHRFPVEPGLSSAVSRRQRPSGRLAGKRWGGPDRQVKVVRGILDAWRAFVVSERD